MVQCEEETNFKGADNRGNLDDLPAMCVNAEEAQLHGQLNQKESGGIWITVARCNDDVSNVKCKRQDEIDKYVSNLSFEVLYADHYLDFNDYSSPLRAHIISD